VNITRHNPAREVGADPGAAVMTERLTVEIECDGATGGASIALPCGRVVTVVVQDAIPAEDLAAARIARGDSDLLAADCRPVAHKVADALVAAGLGRG